MKALKSLVGRVALSITMVLLFLSPALAVDVTLNAVAGSVTMPDGAAVPVWALVEPGGTPFAPIPVISASVGDPLNITLNNALPEAVSLVINGQTPSAAPVPVFFTDLQGRERVFSFTQVAAPAGSYVYSWSSLRAGTYLITSGAHPAVQVPMGLYAVLVVDETPGSETYGVTYQASIPLLLSELDPALNAAVVSTDPLTQYGSEAYPTALAVGYAPKYFLINGQPWSAQDPILDSVNTGDTVLLRFLNTGLRPRSPVINGVTDMTLLAEDGNPLPAAQRPSQHSLDLVAGKTLDALFTAPATEGFVSIQDRMLGLMGGGMTAFIAVDDPAIDPIDLTVAVAGSGSVTATSLPGGIACPGDCSESYPVDTAVTLHATPADVLTSLDSWSVVLASDGVTPTGECTIANADCVVTMSEAKVVTANFITNSATAVTLVSPNGGETIPIDAAYKVRWTAPANALTFTLAYSLAPGFPYVKIADRVPGREFLWSLPYPLIQSDSATLAIIGYDATGTEVARDTSDATFMLQSPFVITAPLGTDVLTGGDATAITWSYRSTTLPIVKASLRYRYDALSAWQPIANVTLADQSYAWTVPNVTTTTTAAQVSLILYNASGQPLLVDISEPFTINPAAAPLGRISVGGFAPDVTPTPAAIDNSLLLLTPNGGEIIPVAAGITVLWQDTNATASYTLKLSLDNGETWTELARDLTDTQYNWLPDPKLAGEATVLLQVEALDETGTVLASDASNEPFALE